MTCTANIVPVLTGTYSFLGSDLVMNRAISYSHDALMWRHRYFIFEFGSVVYPDPELLILDPDPISPNFQGQKNSLKSAEYPLVTVNFTVQ